MLASNRLRLPILWFCGLTLFDVPLHLSCQSCVAEEISFDDKIRPILQKYCVECHGSGVQEGALRLDQFDGLVKGGKSGAPIIPGEPDQSLLMTAVRRTDELLQMPPDEKLPDDVVAELASWIRSGAIHPDGKIPTPSTSLPFDPEKARQFWAFRPVQQPSVPPSTDASRVAAPIDAFVAKKLQEKGLQLNPPADKLTLIRRATFDLTGLPPTPQEIADFLSDRTTDAFGRVVERLLATPQYGERWGRHWLDVVRYADSNGLDENIAHGNAWRYRNYVIASLNADKPYDQFIREQIAGDLLIDEHTPETRRHECLTATGFLSLGPKVLAEGDETKMNLDIIDEQIDTIGKSMLGMTFGCARCHDHKFDPIAQSDYYALSGIFQSTKTMESLKRIAKWNENSIATAADRTAVELHQKQIDAAKAEVSSVLAQANAAAGGQKAEDQLPDDVRKQLAELREKLKKLEQGTPELPTAMGVMEGSPQNARILMRGNHLSPTRIVPRGIPAVLSTNSLTIPPDRSGRLEFAQWLTRPENPLTARVIVNRVWRWHFGRGLVATCDNFGTLGDRPVNPELLDWLAAEFMQQGWSLKWLHGTILRSGTWQQSSRSNPQGEQLDPDNHLQWKWSVQRLEAESIRDSVLAATGLLDKSTGQSMLHVKNREFLFDHTSKDGTSYNSMRRSIYLPVIRNNLYDAMSLFDCTDGTVPNGDRASSTVASQALFFMNSDLILKASDYLAGLLMQEFPNDPEKQAASLFLRTVGRAPGPEDLSDLRQARDQVSLQLQTESASPETLQRIALAAVCQTLLMSSEFVYVR